MAADISGDSLIATGSDTGFPKILVQRKVLRSAVAAIEEKNRQSRQQSIAKDHQPAPAAATIDVPLLERHRPALRTALPQ